MSNTHVLIVDDDAHMSSVLELWFAKANFRTTTASDGHKALEILRGTESFGLILTDFMMPELNGMELLRILGDHPRLCQTPVVMMSNNAEPGFRRRAIELGASAFLLKTDGARLLSEKALRASGY